MFSIIMPTYNCEKYVAEAVRSILAQTYSDFELIIVDDGSTDKTYQKCQEFIKVEERIRLFKIEHKGVSAARNYGIKKANKDYILFVDGDDIWEKNLLEICYGCLSKNEMNLFGIVADFYTNNDVFVDSKSLQHFNPLKLKYQIGKDKEDIFSLFNMSSPCNKVYSREIIIENQLAFSEDCVYLEDLKFNLDYLSIVKIINVIPLDLYRYRLFVDKKQIAKRNFKSLFVNADSLMVSIRKFTDAYAMSINNYLTLQAIAIKAYYDEFLLKIMNLKAIEKRKLLDSLNTNLYYIELLKCTSGKFFSVLKACRFFRLKTLQIKLIQRRYW